MKIIKFLEFASCHACFCVHLKTIGTAKINIHSQGGLFTTGIKITIYNHFFSITVEYREISFYVVWMPCRVLRFLLCMQGRTRGAPAYIVKSYLDQMLLRRNVTQTKCYLDEMLLRPNVSQTKCYQTKVYQTKCY